MARGALGTVVYDTAVSLDGWIADAAGSLEWLLAVEGARDPDPALLPSGATVQVHGSTTYQWVLDQTGALSDPTAWARIAGHRTTFVFTTRDLPVPAGADVRLVRGDVAAVMPQLRAAAAGGDVWVMGGGDLAGQFLDADLLDEVAVTVAPVTLGGGAPLLPRRVEASRLRLVRAHAAGPFARLVYAVVR